ncbi:cyanide hydratase [Verticillium alfalfae VaMs.102]|uniref:Cyanide hydratase n=1 Tax=Verticillium alfalfae (strain VaMs.102 / ATCC MYA-4576 / FGSC 10136) TaxID=526221 RepID=C9SHF4_VERA1|nr:cyanide hydratase [Verticillium alfalfae VaMs.102]EEY18377.1 cyanide hydratase [Verticillium alfalfae VaMs.102]
MPFEYCAKDLVPASAQMPITKYKAAALHEVTSEPRWFDLEAGVLKTINFINEAGQAGCKLVAFPEVWIPGYPYWMWKVTYLQSLPMLKKYRENSLRVDSEEMRRIRRAARDNQVFVSMGFSELDHATLYLAQVLITPTGDIVNHRRKIKPTHVEKLVYGDGAGDTFMSVVETEIGPCRPAQLLGDMNPFLKALNVSMGEQVQRRPRGPCTRTGAWVLAPFQRLSVEGLKMNTPEGVEPETDPSVYNGHARIYRPDGSLVVKPEKDFDGLLFVDIDLNETHLTKVLADFAGHYMRPDLIRLLVDTRRKELVTEAEGQNGIESYSTAHRLGLDRPLDSVPERDVKKVGGNEAALKNTHEG